jgi:hypothetical protein
MGEILITKCQGKMQLGRPKYKWGNNIEIDLRKAGYGFSWPR